MRRGEMASRTQPCPVCGGTMKYGSSVQSVTRGSLEATIRVTGWWCESCGEGILTGDALRRYAEALRDLRRSSGVTP